MKYAYFDGSSGLSGDMILGALIDLGVETRRFKDTMAGLRLPVDISVRRVRRGALAATKVEVRIRKDEQVERTFADVERVILRSRFAPSVKDRALAVFRRLFEAEAKVHGQKVEEVHFHEVGALDSIVDIVGTAICLDHLGIERVYSSPVRLGSGATVRTQHGMMPVPAPATAQLLLDYPTNLPLT